MWSEKRNWGEIFAPGHFKTDIMKRFFLLVLAVVMPLVMSAQAQINTKKEKIEDFTEKTIKVVMTGNIFFDQSFKDEIISRWRISPFEFCTMEEFDSLKTDSGYYFLLLVKSRFRKESRPGMDMLTVVKGGEAAEKGLSKMLDVVTVPLMSSENPSGREFIFLPALLDIIQDHIMKSMETDVAGYSGLSNSNMNLLSAGTKDIIIAEDDLSAEVTPELVKEFAAMDIMVTDTDTADEMMLEHTPNALVSFTVYPSDQEAGSFCYKMLIDAQTHKLYYFRRHKISRKFGPGFLIEDLDRIAER